MTDQFEDVLEEKCSNCYYFRTGHVYIHGQVGECHFSPSKRMDKWPRVQYRDWCGQWRIDVDTLASEEAANE